MESRDETLEKSEHLIAEFRTSPQLRIAVTVDMIATGSDIKPLECLLFLRDVRSRVYFEQMKGRGTRVLSPTELQAVSGADARAKTHFVIADAVGVCESDKTDSRPLEKKPTVALDSLLLGVALGRRDEDTLTTLAGRLARLERVLDESGKQELREMTDGRSLGQMSAALLRALDPHVIAERATGKPDADPQEVEPSVFEKAKLQLALEACAPFDKPEVRNALVRFRQQNEQTIDRITIDQVIDQGFDDVAKEKAESLVKSFRDYIEQHRAEIATLQILYSRPFKQRLTEEGLKELEAKLKQEPQFGLDPVAKVWSAFEHSDGKSTNRASQTRRFTDLISLVRTAIEPATPLEPFEDHVKQRFTVWLEEKRAAGITFTPDQFAWLEKMRDYISASGSVDRDHLEADNVLGPIYRAFGEGLWPLMEELNLTLAA